MSFLLLCFRLLFIFRRFVVVLTGKSFYAHSFNEAKYTIFILHLKLLFYPKFLHVLSVLSSVSLVPLVPSVIMTMIS